MRMEKEAVRQKGQRSWQPEAHVQQRACPHCVITASTSLVRQMRQRCASLAASLSFCRSAIACRRRQTFKITVLGAHYTLAKGR